MPKPKKPRINKSEAVLEALKGSRDPLTTEQVAEIAKVTRQQAHNAIAHLRDGGAIKPVGRVEGTRKSLWMFAEGKADTKPRRKKAAKRARTASPVTPGGGVVPAGAMRLWLSSGGALRIERGAEAMDLTPLEALTLQNFMVTLKTITPESRRK